MPGQTAVMRLVLAILVTLCALLSTSGVTYARESKTSADAVRECMRDYDVDGSGPVEGAREVCEQVVEVTADRERKERRIEAERSRRTPILPTVWPTQGDPGPIDLAVICGLGGALFALYGLFVALTGRGYNRDAPLASRGGLSALMIWIGGASMLFAIGVWQSDPFWMLIGAFAYLMLLPLFLLIRRRRQSSRSCDEEMPTRA